MDYTNYVSSFLADGMIPLSFEEWAELKDPEHYELSD